MRTRPDSRTTARRGEAPRGVSEVDLVVQPGRVGASVRRERPGGRCGCARGVCCRKPLAVGAVLTPSRAHEIGASCALRVGWTSGRVQENSIAASQSALGDVEEPDTPTNATSQILSLRRAPD